MMSSFLPFFLLLRSSLMGRRCYITSSKLAVLGATPSTVKDIGSYKYFHPIHSCLQSLWLLNNCIVIKPNWKIIMWLFLVTINRQIEIDRYSGVVHTIQVWCIIFCLHVVLVCCLLQSFSEEDLLQSKLVCNITTVLIKQMLKLIKPQ